MTSGTCSRAALGGCSAIACWPSQATSSGAFGDEYAVLSGRKGLSMNRPDPMTPDEVREKYIEDDGDDEFVIGTGLACVLISAIPKAQSYRVQGAIHAIIADATKAQQERIKELEARVAELEAALRGFAPGMPDDDGTDHTVVQHMHQIETSSICPPDVYDDDKPYCSGDDDTSQAGPEAPASRRGLAPRDLPARNDSHAHPGSPEA